MEAVGHLSTCVHQDMDGRERQVRGGSIRESMNDATQDHEIIH